MEKTVMGSVLAPERILKELSELWGSMAKPADAENGGGSHGVLRACSMTLVVLSEEKEDAGAVGETLAALMPEHPARTVMVRLREGGERFLADRVYAQCWMPFGQRRQICCEQIEITASDAALGDLPSVVLPLSVADLPLIVWCRASRLLGLPEFRAIAGMAHKVVVDSAGLADARTVLRRFAESPKGDVLLADLAWTRLTRWREMLSQVFENRAHVELLPGVAAARVHFGGSLETAARYMAAWIENSLAKIGVRPEIGVEGTGGSADPLSVTLTGAGLKIELKRQENRLVAAINGLSNCTSLSEPTDYLLMREELGILRRDTIFEAALSSAARNAYPTDR